MAYWSNGARLLATTAVALVMVGSAHAQTAAEQTEAQSQGGLADIVVTATRRATNVQDVPIAVTAVGGEALMSQGISDGVQLARVVPNLFATAGYAGGNLRYAIRGLGSTDFSQGGSSPVGIYVDDVYQPYSFGIGSQLFDLDRVEVLRGPQGTLFGKNTTGGAVAYFSARPTDTLEGYLNSDIMWGQFGKYTAEGMINTPLVRDTLNARFDLRYERRDSFVRNVFDGGKLGEYDSIAARAQFDWRAGDNTRVNLKLFYMKSDGDATLYHGGFIRNICDPANPDPANTPYANCNNGALPPTYEGIGSTSDEVPSFERYNNYGATLKVEHDLGAGWDLTAITGYQKVDYKLLTNDDGNSTDFFHSRQDLKAWQISQEFRVATPADKPVSAIFGLFGQYDRALTPTASGSTFFGPPLDYVLRADSNQKSTTLAAFTNVTLKATDTLSLIGGLRYSYERKKINLVGLEVFNGTVDFTNDNLTGFDPTNPVFGIDPFADIPFTQTENRVWKRLTWDATLNYKPNDDVLLYAKIAEGFRSGGYNLFAVTASSVATVNPEILRSYEIGLKTELLDRRLRVNAAGFYYDVSDQQILSTGANGAGVVLSNAGASTIKGFELEVEAAPVDALRLTASLGYTDATFDRFNTTRSNVPISLAGNRLAYAPKWTLAGSATYDVDVGGGYTVKLNSDWNYRTSVYFDAYNLPYTSDGNLLLGNARVTLLAPEGGTQWHVAAYVQNLTNKAYHAFGFFTGDAWYSRVYGDRRIWGVQAGMKF